MPMIILITDHILLTSDKFDDQILLWHECSDLDGIAIIKEPKKVIKMNIF